MTKYSVVVKVFLYYILITIVANSLLMTVSGGSNMTFATIPANPNILDILGFAWDLMGIFFGFFTFSISGFPPVLAVILFWLPAVYILLYIIGVIRGGGD
jgi:hypothetical protein